MNGQQTQDVCIGRPVSPPEVGRYVSFIFPESRCHLNSGIQKENLVDENLPCSWCSRPSHGGVLAL
jgi:hypothetical protein